MKKLLLLAIAVLALTSCEKEEMREGRRKRPKAEAVVDDGITGKRGQAIEYSFSFNASLGRGNSFSSYKVHSVTPINEVNANVVFLEDEYSGYRVLLSSNPSKPILGITPITVNITGAVVVDNTRPKFNPVYSDTSEMLGGYDPDVDGYTVGGNGVTSFSFNGSAIKTHNNIITRVRDISLNVK